MNKPLQSAVPPDIDRRTARRRSTDSADIRMLRLSEVTRMCALGRTSVYDAVSKGQFPAPVSMLTRAPRWIHHEIQEWLAQRIKNTRQS